MKKCNKKKGWGIHVLSVFMLMLAFCLPVSAGVQEGEGEYEVYPTPQNVVYGDGTVALTDQINVTYGDTVDAYTKTRVLNTLEVLDLEASTSSAAANVNLIVGVYGQAGDPAAAYGASHNVDASIYEKYDAYTLWIQGKDIVILGKNTDAAYYGVTTLKRIFEQLDGKSVRELTLKDYAEIEFRGFIEGYYGNPWSHEDRMDLMKFGGEIKMNQYVFAPKDDPYHNAQWRELYPTEEDPNGSDITDIEALAKAGNESKCFFVYALHPFQNSPLTEANYAADLQVLKNKLAQVIEAGVRQVAILEDDASANGRWTATTLSRLLTDVENWLKEMKNTYPDLKTDLLFCPGWMAYANSMTNSGDGDVQKIKSIYENSPDEVRIVMTGGKVWGEVNEPFSDNFYARMAETSKGGSYPYLWVNWPCNDNTHNSLIMGGHNTILHTQVNPDKFRGVILNPMQHSEPSKVGIFTASDYCWKIWDEPEEGDQAWDDSFKYIDHMTPVESEESNALREVAKHMINQKPTQPQVQFEESVEIKDQILEFTEKMKGGTLTSEDITEMRAEFKKIDDAVKLYLERGTNRRIAGQMEPFMNSFSDTLQADINLLDALEAISAGDHATAYDKYSQAMTLNERSQTYSIWYVNHYEYALGGRKYIKPFTETALRYLSDEMKKIVDPENIPFEKELIFQVGGSTTASSVEGSPANAMDGSMATTYLIKTNQKVGDYIGIAFNMPVEVKNIQLALTVDGHLEDYFYAGKMEYTEDGKVWKEFTEELQPESGTEVKMELPEAVTIRGFRWKCTDLGGKNRWLGIKDVGYNVKEQQQITAEKYTAAFSCTSGWTVTGGSSAANITDDDESSYVWYNPSTGTKDTTLAGDYIQLDLGEAKPVGRVRVLVGAGDGDKWTEYHLEHSVNGTDWTSLPAYTGVTSGMDTYQVSLRGASARYLRLVNNVTLNKWVKFCDFSAYDYVEEEEEPEGDIMDYTNTKDEKWRVEYGYESSKVFPRENATLQPGEYIGLKLSRIRAVKEINVAGAGTESLILEKSINRQEWKEADKEGAARYIRLMNKGSQAVTFSLDTFVVTSDEIFPISFLDSNIGNTDSNQDARSLKTTGNWLDGDLSTAAKYTAAPSAGSYVLYDLGQEITIKSLKVWVSSGAKDYPRDAKIQASLTNGDAAEWEDILVIGDGVADDRDSSFDRTPTQNGWTAGTGAVGVNYAYQATQEPTPVRARYLRLYCTAANAGRWVELNEIEINDGEYMPTAIDPTFETDATQEEGFEIYSLNDGNLTTTFSPAGEDNQSGYLIYHLSDTVEVGQINVLQSGNKISHAKVSVRIGENEWKPLGTMDKSLSSFDTTDLEAVYAVKIEWEGIKPVLYEISIQLGPKLSAAEESFKAADREIAAAESALKGIDAQIAAAKTKVETASDAEAKLRAEVELQNLYVQQAEKAADLAAKKAIAAEKAAEVARLQAEKLRMSTRTAGTAEEKAELETKAQQQDDVVKNEQAEYKVQKAAEAKKKQEKANYAEIAAKKQQELNVFLDNKKPSVPNPNPNPNPNPGPGPNPIPTPVKDFTYKNVKYKVLNASAKTVAAVGVQTKKVKSVTINTAKEAKSGVTYKVVQINDKAFKGCKKLTKVTIGNNVKKIGKEAFAQCTRLKTINMKKASGITSIGKKAFTKIQAKAKITVPAKKLKKYKKLLKKAGVPKKAVIKK